MLFPIKLNLACFPRSLNHILPCMEDPRPLLEGSTLSYIDFTRSVSALYIGGTWKTTQSSRHPLSDKIISALSIPSTSILEVGASVGVTSLELIEQLGSRFANYIVSDANCKLFGLKKGKWINFYSTEGECILRSGFGFLFYNQTKGGWFPFKQISEKLIRNAPPFDPCRAVVLELFIPELVRKTKLDCRVSVIEWNIFQPWELQLVDIVRVANLLNRSYFSDYQIKTAIINLHKIIKPGGKLLLVENRKLEQWSLLMNGPSGFEVLDQGNGGSDVQSLACG